MTGRIVLKLYVFGDRSPVELTLNGMAGAWEGVSREAIELVVVDVAKHPEIAEEARILATPTLVRENPAPARKLIGDLSDLNRVASFLGLQAKNKGSAKRQVGRAK